MDGSKKNFGPSGRAFKGTRLVFWPDGHGLVSASPVEKIVRDHSKPAHQDFLARKIAIARPLRGPQFHDLGALKMEFLPLAHDLGSLAELVVSN